MFRNIVKGSCRKSIEGGFRILHGDRAHHDDGTWKLGHDATQGFQTIEARHLHVEGNHIGIERRNFLQGFGATGRRSDDPETRIESHDARKCHAHEGAVVHDEHPYLRVVAFVVHVRYMARTRLWTSSI